jgi:hypothetical protein
VDKLVCNRKKAARRLASPAAAAILATLGGSASALDLNPGGDWQIRWDNTVKYSGGVRVKAADLAAVSANSDDGNRSFDKGLISNRVDLLSEFDAQRDGFGLRLSAAAWYDSVYNRSNDHDSPLTANKSSVAFNQFTPGSRDMAGRKAEMLDWFVFGRSEIADTTLSYRLGQHSLIWGTSLFFGMNGMAKGMAPVDVYKLSIPGTQAKETTMPVPQLSGTLQLSDDTSVEAYVQFKYRATRLHPAGSYLSTADMLGAGAERMFIGDPLLGGHRCGSTAVAPPRRFANCYLDYVGMDEGKKTHNFGFALNTRSDALNADFGIYATSYRDTAQLIQTSTTGGIYRLIVPTDPVRAIGVSMAKLIGDANVGIEFSVRDGQPLALKEAVLTPTDTGYVTGRTAHLNVSSTLLFGKSGLWDGASLLGEFAANHVQSIQDVRTKIAGRWPVGTEKVNRDRSRNSSGLRVIFTPTYYQAAPGLDLSVPVNVGWSFQGFSMVDNSFPFGGSPDRSGEVILGLTGVYLSKWTGNISFINYVGKASSQPSLDRDYLRFSLQASF